MTSTNVFVAQNVLELLKSLEVFYPKNTFIEQEINACNRIIREHNIKNIEVINPSKKEIATWKNTVKRYILHDFKQINEETLLMLIPDVVLDNSLRDQFILTMREKSIPYGMQKDFFQNRKIINEVRNFIRTEVQMRINKKLKYETSK